LRLGDVDFLGEFFLLKGDGLLFKGAPVELIPSALALT
jgi:hypothetical protein